MSEANRSRRTRYAYTLHLIEVEANCPEWNWIQVSPDLPLRGFESEILLRRLLRPSFRIREHSK